MFLCLATDYSLMGLGDVLVEKGVVVVIPKSTEDYRGPVDFHKAARMGLANLLYLFSSGS